MSEPVYLEQSKSTIPGYSIRKQLEDLAWSDTEQRHIILGRSMMRQLLTEMPGIPLMPAIGDEVYEYVIDTCANGPSLYVRCDWSRK